jgi:hypothetical protein
MRVPNTAKDRGERVEVLSQAAIKDVNLGPTTVVGPTPGTMMSDGSSIDNGVPRESIDLVKVAPVIADATANAKELPTGAEVTKIRRFRVLNQNGKHVNDPSAGGRVFIHEGKEITTQHYDIRKLQQQGVRLKEITDVAEDEPIFE